MSDNKTVWHIEEIILKKIERCVECCSFLMYASLQLNCLTFYYNDSWNRTTSIYKILTYTICISAQLPWHIFYC
jgi:hypothetical protein